MPPNKLGKIGRVHVLASAEYRQTHFMCRQWTSILLVLYPSLFTNSFEWFTVWCEYPCLFKLWYDFQQSETINVPGSIQSFMIGKSVASLLSSTATKKHLLESSSIPPNTHCPSTLCPRWYFHFPTLLSSIWTTFPSFLDGHFTFLCKTYPSRQLCWH